MLFSTAYHGAQFIEIFDHKQAKKKKLILMTAPKKVYDNEVKGYIFTANSYTLPANSKFDLGIKQSFLVFQCYFMEGIPMNFEISVKTTQGQKKRLLFTSAFKEIQVSTFHIKVPIGHGIPRNDWVNMCIDIDSILSVDNLNFLMISSIQIKGFVKMRRIFTLKQPLGFFDGSEIGRDLIKGKVIMPKAISLPIPTYNLDINLDFIEDHQDSLAVSGKKIGGKRNQDDRSTNIQTPNSGMGGSRNTNYTMNFGGTQQGRTYHSYKSPKIRNSSKGGAGRKNPKYMSQEGGRMRNAGRVVRDGSQRKGNAHLRSPFEDEDMQRANIKCQNFEFEFEVSNTQNTNFQKKMSRTNPHNKPRGAKNKNLTRSAQRPMKGRSMIRNKTSHNGQKVPSRGRRNSINKQNPYSRQPKNGVYRKNNPYATGYNPEPYNGPSGFEIGNMEDGEDDELISIGKQKLMMRQAKKERARLMRIDRGNKSINNKKLSRTSQDSFQNFSSNARARDSVSRESQKGRATFLHDQEEDLTDFQNLENEVKTQENDMMMKFNSTGNHEGLADLVFNNDESIVEDFEHDGDTYRHLKPNMHLEGDEVDLDLGEQDSKVVGFEGDQEDEFNETQRLDNFAKNKEESEVGDMDDLIDEMMNTNMNTTAGINKSAMKHSKVTIDLQDSLEMDKSQLSKKSKSTKISQTPIKDITTFVDELIGNKNAGGASMRPYSPPSSNLIDLIDPNKSVITRKANQTVVLDYSSKRGVSTVNPTVRQKDYDADYINKLGDVNADITHLESSNNSITNKNQKKLDITELEYDALLDCYYDPKTGTYHAKQ